LGPKGREQPVLLSGDSYFDLSGLTGDISGEFFEGDGIARSREALTAGSLRRLGPMAEQRVGAPITRPSAVICIGMNYAAHAAESGSMPTSVKSRSKGSADNDNCSFDREKDHD
jgi:2-keto-4-pentenoate hydratase/2-oxohepta-3-ene-1,7-dioic acid hydratase in catechol pathway